MLALMTTILSTGCAITDTYKALYGKGSQSFKTLSDEIVKGIEKNAPAPFEYESPPLSSYYQPVIQAHGANLYGPLDTSFNSSGMSTLQFGNNSVIARAVAIQTDGKIVTVGNTRSVHPSNANKFIALARSNKDGRLDASFGRLGMVATSDTWITASAVAIQADGKIVVSGTGASLKHNSYSSEISLIRYNIDGSLDPRFGAGGVATKSINFSFLAVPTKLAIQLDGKIVVLGSEGIVGRKGGTFLLLRFNKDGSLDSTFGENGKASTSFSGSFDSPRAIAIQADGKIVVVGTSSIPRKRGKSSQLGIAWGQDFDFSLARYNTDGSLDSTFGVGGRMTTDSGGAEMANAVAMQTDGKIVVAGSAVEQLIEGQTGKTRGGIGLVRYNPNGSIDQTFAAGGMVKTLDETLKNKDVDVVTHERVAQAVAIQPNGKIVVVTGEDFSVLRYTTDGHLDTDFGAGGEARVQMGKTSHTGYALALQADGKIVAVGSVGDKNEADDDFAIVRYLPEGASSSTTVDNRIPAR